MFYLQPESLISLYNKTFNDDKDNLSDEEIDHLSMTIKLNEALAELTEDKLTEFAKDNDIRLCCSIVTAFHNKFDKIIL